MRSSGCRAPFGSLKRREPPPQNPRRDQSKTDKALAALTEAAQGTQNLIPFIYESVKNKATLGEIADTLRQVFGQYKENVVV